MLSAIFFLTFVLDLAALTVKVVARGKRVHTVRIVLAKLGLLGSLLASVEMPAL